MMKAEGLFSSTMLPSTCWGSKRGLKGRAPFRRRTKEASSCVANALRSDSKRKREV